MNFIAISEKIGHDFYYLFVHTSVYIQQNITNMIFIIIFGDKKNENMQMKNTY